MDIDISHTIRPLNYKNICIEEIFSYIDVINELGIKSINLNIKMFESIDNISEWLHIANKLNRYIIDRSMKVSVVHAPYENSLILNGSTNEILIRKTMLSIDIAKIFGSQKVVIHTGISYDENGYSEELTIMNNISFWLKVCQYAHKEGVTVAFENDIVHDTLDNQSIFKPHITTINKFVTQINNEYNLSVGLCYDVGHANIAKGNVVEDISTIKDNLVCLHLHNNYGYINKENAWKNDTHNPCYNGIIDFEKLFISLKEIGYKDNLVIESVYRDTDSRLSDEIKKDYEYIVNLSRLLNQ